MKLRKSKNSKISKISKNNPNPIIIRDKKQKVEKPIMTQYRMQTRQQTKMQEELNQINEESELESE